MNFSSQIKHNMPVVGNESTQFALVDALDGEAIRLTKDNSGAYHTIPLSWVKLVDDKVHVDRTRDQAIKDWTVAPAPKA